MLARIRQVATIAQDLEEATGRFSRVLSIEPTRWGDLPAYGLRNAILPTGRGICQRLSGQSGLRTQLEDPFLKHPAAERNTD